MAMPIETRSQAALSIADQGVISHQPGRCVIMPSIAELSDGQWIAGQNVGSSVAAPDHSIEVLKSTDRGASWRHLGSIISDEQQRGWSYRGSTVNELPDGRLVMNTTRFEATPGDLFDVDSEALKRPEMVLLWSEDRGETWSAPVPVPTDFPPDRYTCNGSGNLVIFSPSRWMFPFETWKPEGYAGKPDQKAAAVFSADSGRTWGDAAFIADDVAGKVTYWDQNNTLLPDGRCYVMAWTHVYGTSEDLPVHWTASSDEGATWSPPRPTNLRGQVCCPIALPDGRVAAVYNYRHEPQGVRVAVSDDLETFDLEREIVIFDARTEASLGKADHENFLAEHQLIGFGKPYGIALRDGSLLTCYWCTVDGVTHTRWARLTV